MALTEQILEPDIRPSLETLLEMLSPRELGVEMAALLSEDVAELSVANDPDFHSALVRSCTENLAQIWSLVCDPSPDVTSVEPPPGAAAFAREFAHRGLPLSVLLRAYRLGHGHAEHRIAAVSETLELEAEVRWRILAIFTQRTFDYIDVVCTKLVEDYEQERARWVRGAAAARAECVQAIIDRRPTDTSAATERLGYDVSRRHLGFIVWSQDGDAGEPGLLERTAIELARSVGGGPTLTIPVGERVVWGWTSGEQLTDDAHASVGRLPSGLRAALGTPARGPAGMAESHEDALAVRRTSDLIAQRPGSVVSYRAVALLTMLVADPERALRFVELELGELAEETDAMLRLRATLRVYLEEGLSPARASRRLSIHLNTVVYRVKQAEGILGRPVADRRLEFEAALRLAERVPALRDALTRTRHYADVASGPGRSRPHTVA